MKHTQGEWIVKNHAQFSNIKNIIVKDVNILSITNQRASDIESEANAALIAAAPELLKMCIATLEDLQSGEIDNTDTKQMAIENLINAINKATKTN